MNTFLTRKVLEGKIFKSRFLQKTLPKNFDFCICCREWLKVLDSGGPNSRYFFWPYWTFLDSVLRVLTMQMPKMYILWSLSCVLTAFGWFVTRVAQVLTFKIAFLRIFCDPLDFEIEKHFFLYYFAYGWYLTTPYFNKPK